MQGMQRAFDGRVGRVRERFDRRHAQRPVGGVDVGQHYQRNAARASKVPQQTEKMKAHHRVEFRLEQAAECGLTKGVQLRHAVAQCDVGESVDGGFVNECPLFFDRPANLFDQFGAGGVAEQLQERQQIDPRHLRERWGISCGARRAFDGFR